MAIACPAPRIIFHWLPCHCWPLHPPATKALWPLSSPAPTRPTQPFCAHRKALASVGRSGVRHVPGKQAVHCSASYGPVSVVTSPLNGAHPLMQVVLIGDGVGGILGFDALCHSANTGTGSRCSSRRGSMVSVAKPASSGGGLSLSISRSLPWAYYLSVCRRVPSCLLSSSILCLPNPSLCPCF